MRHGLVIGKFYPPHAGHKYLLDTAIAQCDHVRVLVVEKEGERPTANLRAGWLREMGFDAATIDDIGRDDDSMGWAEHTLNWLGDHHPHDLPDVVFGSEPYIPAYAAAITVAGEANRWKSALAHWHGCAGVLVDPSRTLFPISGTAVRADPYRHWHYLDPVVRAYYVKRICIMGAESTGTTAMAKLLAPHYQTTWVPEYGREFAERRENSNSPWCSADFWHIATEQCRREDAAVRQARKILICDTDAFVTSMWHEAYLGTRLPKLDRLAASRHYDLTLFTDIDIPFEQDGTRDPVRRARMHDAFLEALSAVGRPYIVLSGNPKMRMETAVRAIDALFGAD